MECPECDGVGVKATVDPDTGQDDIPSRGFLPCFLCHGKKVITAEIYMSYADEQLRKRMQLQKWYLAFVVVLLAAIVISRVANIC